MGTGVGGGEVNAVFTPKKKVQLWRADEEHHWV